MKMPKFAQAEADRFKADAKELIGARIVGADAAYLDNAVWPFLILKTDDGREYVLQALRDHEGNGPGALVHKGM